MIGLYSIRKPYKLVKARLIMAWQKPLAFFVLIITLSTLAAGQEDDLANISLVDSYYGTEILNVTAHISYNNKETQVILARDGNVRLSRNLLQDPVEITLDDPNTDGMDYFFYGDINTDEEEVQAILFPVSQVRGNVYDSLNNLVRGVSLEFDCDKPTGIKFPDASDKYGAFSSYVPIGKCVISATNGKMIDKQTIETNRGASYELNLKLEKEVSFRQNYYWVILVGILGLILFYFRREKIPGKKKKQVENKELKTITKTLNEKERSIVDFLINNGNKSTSSKIRHAMKMPKTSLSRILERLEAKKVVEIERNGKLKQIRLSGWLLKK